MRPSLIIPRLRANCPSFSNRIGGAVDFEGAQLSEELAVPCAFVIPIATQPSENELLGGLVAQDITEVFGIAICISNTEDERGQDSAEVMHDLIDEIKGVLIGWIPGADFGPVEWSGVDFTAPDRARLWATISFSVRTFVNS